MAEDEPIVSESSTASATDRKLYYSLFTFAANTALRKCTIGVQIFFDWDSYLTQYNT